MSKDKKIATLWDGKNSDEQNNEEGSAQAFYAGGSEHSGQQILGPAAADRLFQRTSQSSALLQDPSVPGGPTLPVVFWRNGFTIGDDAELHQYELAENRNFLECLRRGETPPELASRTRGGMIDVKLENKAHLDYKPEPKRLAFSGEGHRLGAPAPETVEHEPAASVSNTASQTSGQAIRTSLSVDESLPVTTIQVRLLDNTRLVVRANFTHTVGDIVEHIRSVRPQYSETTFVLATSFPAKELGDLGQTVSDAKLANASVLQKLKR